MTMWMMQRKGELSVLVHTNSGCVIEDHSWWALWGGIQWPLDFSYFKHDQPWPWPVEDTQGSFEGIREEDQNKLIL